LRTSTGTGGITVQCRNANVSGKPLHEHFVTSATSGATLITSAANTTFLGGVNAPETAITPLSTTGNIHRHHTGRRQRAILAFYTFRRRPISTGPRAAAQVSGAVGRRSWLTTLMAPSRFKGGTEPSPSAGEGILTSAATGFTSITTRAPVSGTTNGISASSTTGNINDRSKQHRDRHNGTGILATFLHQPGRNIDVTTAGGLVTVRPAST